MHRLSSRLHRSVTSFGMLRLTLLLLGVFGISSVAAQIATPVTAQASSWLRYQRGYYLDRGWMCFGWANGAYHCTHHWHHDANGTLISDNPAWVSNAYHAVPAKPVASAPERIAPAYVAPKYVAPAPKYVAPAPKYVAPAPKYVAPAPKYIAPAPAPVSSQSVINEIYAVFGPYGSQAVNVARCESGFNPNAYNSISVGGAHAAGVFQILDSSTWYGTSYAGQSPYNASANIHAAYQIFSRDGFSWREWVCKP